MSGAAAGRGRLRAWFSARGWRPFDFQEATWDAWAAGEDGLLHVPTGVGKTLAAVGGPLCAALDGSRETEGEGGLRILWLTPLRALARDTEAALRELVDGLGLAWRVERRTGDTSGSARARQKRRPPEILITTPESLSILLTDRRHPRLFDGLDTVVVDEWHELVGSKRGVQTELGLARLRALRPELRTWGLSATLPNLDEALETLLGVPGVGRIVGPSHDVPDGTFSLRTVLPGDPERFPWAGHLGLRLLDPVVEHLEAPGTTLLFTNTRSQAELWHRAILDARPGWDDQVLLHHGSLSREERARAEAGLREGTLRCVVCTSTLDLGVDFSPVDRVVQVGSPRGVGRLLQRAGRSGHRPGGRREVLCVPTHALELVEFAAAREAVAAGSLEPRRPLDRPLDVLAQHLVTRALGGGFTRDEMAREIRSTRAYREVSDEALDWCLDFVTRGGAALEAYPRYHRVVQDEGRYVVTSRQVARQHRMSVGTITDDGQMEVRFLKGGRLGRVEESFVSRLAPGDRFLFAGRELELVRTREMVAWVRLARGRKARRPVPRWAGGRMPLSSHLAETVAAVLAGTRAAEAPEMAAMAPLLEIQARWSALPAPGRLLAERHESREGHHLFVFPFLGRAAHDGLAALVAHRLSLAAPRTVTVSANDYGFEILSPDPLPEAPKRWTDLWTPERLVPDLRACLNATELARRRFREVARVSGLVFQGPPDRSKSARQLQASAGLIYDVLSRWDPDNLLLDQAHREVLEAELEVRRLREGLERMSGLEPLWTRPPRLTPLAFPIWAERIQAQVSTESWVDRVRRMAGQLERAAGDAAGSS